MRAPPGSSRGKQAAREQDRGDGVGHHLCLDVAVRRIWQQREAADAGRMHQGEQRLAKRGDGLLYRVATRCGGDVGSDGHMRCGGVRQAVAQRLQRCRGARHQHQAGTLCCQALGDRSTDAAAGASEQDDAAAHHAARGAAAAPSMERKMSPYSWKKRRAACTMSALSRGSSTVFINFSKNTMCS
jgi:hypothetical protein